MDPEEKWALALITLLVLTSCVVMLRLVGVV